MNWEYIQIITNYHNLQNVCFSLCKHGTYSPGQNRCHHVSQMTDIVSTGQHLKALDLSVWGLRWALCLVFVAAKHACVRQQN